MSIENISKISSRKYKNITDLFDVPSLEDNDAIVSYILTVEKDDVTIKKLEDYTNYFDELNDITAREIDSKNKKDKMEYIMFLKALRAYIKKARYIMFMEEEKTDTLISDDDLSTISKHYKEEIRTLKEDEEDKKDIRGLKKGLFFKGKLKK